MKSAIALIRFFFLMFVVLIGFLSSCKSPIDIDTDDSDPVIVIYGILTDEYKQQEVRVSISSPYFYDQSNASISGAVVTIESSDGKLFELLEANAIPGLYQTASSWAAVPGITYRLNVSVDFNGDGVIETYQAETRIIPFAGIDSLNINAIDIMGFDHFSVNAYWQDEPGEDHYLCKYAINDSLITEKISLFQCFEDTSLDGEYIDGFPIWYFDAKSTEHKIPDDIKEDIVIFVDSGDKIELQMSRITKGFYDFIIQCQQEMRGENPMFGGPASNITTNISNGGVGYFSGYCIRRAYGEAP